MPLYEFVNEQTGEVETHQMRISELDEFKENNPHLKSKLSAPNLVRDNGLQGKMDNGWKENLARIAEAHPTSALADRVGGRKTKEAKTQEVAKKYGKLKSGKYSMDL